MQVEMLNSDSYTDLGMQINKTIHKLERKNCTIIDIKFTSNNFIYVAMIIYQEEYQP